MVNCSAYGCKSRSPEPGISFHGFPNELEKRKIWIKNMKVDNWEPTANSRLCSKHFQECFLYKTDTHSRSLLLNKAIPTIFPQLPKHLQPKLVTKRALAIISPKPGPSTSAKQPDPDTPRNRKLTRKLNQEISRSKEKSRKIRVLEQSPKRHESSPSVPCLSVVPPSKLFKVNQDPLSMSPIITGVPSHLDEDEYSSSTTIKEPEADTYLEKCRRTERHQSSPFPRLSIVSPSKLLIVTEDSPSKSPIITTVPSHLDENEHSSSSTITVRDPEADTYLEKCTRTERKRNNAPRYFGDCDDADMVGSKKIIRNWEIAKKTIQEKHKKIRKLQRNNRSLKITISNLKSSMTYLKDQFQISKNAKFALDAAEQKDNICVADCNMDQVTCRTCLAVIKKKNFSKISQTCYLSKTIKDVILLLVPEMASTLFDHEWVCKNCVQTLKSCMRFIERCLEIELQNAEKQKALEQSSDEDDWSETKENSNEIEENGVPLINNLEQINLDHSYHANIEPEDCDNINSKHSETVEADSNLPDNDATAFQLFFNSSLPDNIELSIEDDDSTSPEYMFCESLSADKEGTVEYDDKIEDSSERSRSQDDSLLPQKSTTSSEYLDSETSKLNSAETDKYTCSTCSEKFSCSLDYKLHLQIHPAFMCHHCGKCMSTQRTYECHMKVHTQKALKLCELCGKHFMNMGALKEHIATVHQPDSLYMCHKCPKRFKRKGSLKMHVQIVHEKARQQQCQECGKLFCNRITYLTHYRLIHLKIKQYVCKVCGKEFGRKDHLHKHLHIHTGEPKPRKNNGFLGRRPKNGIRLKDPGVPVTCKICGKSVASVYFLKTHLQSHLKMKRHQCKYCNLTFTLASNRDRHQQRHESDPENKFRCDICWKWVKTEQERDMHIQAHYSNRPPRYTCDVCGEKFHRKYLMHNHQLNMHTNPEDIEKAEKEIVVNNLLEYAHPDCLADIGPGVDTMVGST